MGGDASHVGTTPGADEMDSDRMRLRCPRTARVATSSSLRLPFPARAPLRALRPAPEELGKPGGRLRSSLGAARARMLGLPRLDQPRPSEATLEPLRGEQGRWLARAILPSRGSPGGTRAPSPRATRAAQGCQTPTQPRRIRAQPKSTLTESVPGFKLQACNFNSYPFQPSEEEKLQESCEQRRCPDGERPEWARIPAPRPKERTDDEGKEVNCVVYLQGNCCRERRIRQEGEDDASRPLPGAAVMAGRQVSHGIRVGRTLHADPHNPRGCQPDSSAQRGRKPGPGPGTKAGRSLHNICSSAQNGPCYALGLGSSRSNGLPSKPPNPISFLGQTPGRGFQKVPEGPSVPSPLQFLPTRWLGVRATFPGSISSDMKPRFSNPGAWRSL
ncbi:hypothetical protein J1605_009844 [Eschrichtius robustus]|uniref:Uncharacterized protein n=1 Tax=Eschrichtius robustus TaxID=9764 RepID=A0AB34GQI1_ESCRO|nr:hypothetical protein J1605_009844 [Eschrichtius robustus]